MRLFDIRSKGVIVALAVRCDTVGVDSDDDVGVVDEDWATRVPGAGATRAIAQTRVVGELDVQVATYCAADVDE